MDTCIYMAESLHCSPETVTTLLIGYIPMQNVFGVILKKNKLFKKKEGKKGMKGIWSQASWVQIPFFFLMTSDFEHATKTLYAVFFTLIK